MSDFSSIGPNMNGTPSPLGPIHRMSGAAPHSEAGRLTNVNGTANSGTKGDADRVEVSNFAKYLAQLRELPQVRHDRVEQLRESIRDEAYESDEKLDIAIERWAREEL